MKVNNVLPVGVWGGLILAVVLGCDQGGESFYRELCDVDITDFVRCTGANYMTRDELLEKGSALTAADIAINVFAHDRVELLNAIVESGLGQSRLFGEFGNYEWPNAHETGDGVTLFHLACRFRATKCRRYLQSKGYQFDLDFREGGVFADLVAVPFEEAQEILGRFENQNSGAIDSVDRYGCTALSYALMYDNFEYAKWLVAHGAKCSVWGKSLGDDGEMLWMSICGSVSNAAMKFIVSRWGLENGRNWNLLLLSIPPYMEDYDSWVEKIVGRGASLNGAMAGVWFARRLAIMNNTYAIVCHSHEGEGLEDVEVCNRVRKYVRLGLDRGAYIAGLKAVSRKRLAIATLLMDMYGKIDFSSGGHGLEVRAL